MKTRRESRVYMSFPLQKTIGFAGQQTHDTPEPLPASPAALRELFRGSRARASCPALSEKGGLFTRDVLIAWHYYDINMTKVDTMDRHTHTYI